MRKIIFPFVLVISFGFSLILFKSHDNITYTSFIRGEGEEEEESPIKKAQTAIEREEYFFSILRDPRTNSIPENIREKEIAFASRLPKSEERLAKGLNALAFNWKEAGPVDVGGRTRAIVVDVSNSNVIIAAGVSGGIWKSTDKGATWISKSSKSSILSVTSIAQDPTAGNQNNWYAVGGEFDGNSARSRGGGASFYGGGFYRSTDNGENWNLVATNLPAPIGTGWNSMFSYASKVIVSPTSGNIFVGSNAGVILKSTDRGSTWTTVLGVQNNHYYSDIIVNQNGVLVAALSKLAPISNPTDNPGIFKSTNDGSILTWTNITPVDFPIDTCSRSVMAFGTSNANLIYVLTNTGNKIGSTTKDDVRLFKIDITNTPATSTNLTSKLPDLNDNRDGFINTQNDYNMAIAVHPTNENIVFIAGSSLFRSLDGFATKLIDQKLNWIGGYNLQTFFYNHLHPDIHTIVFDQSNPVGIWVGHDGGISYAPDPTTTNYPADNFPWVDRDNNYNVTQYYTMAISPTSGDTRIVGGTQDNGTPYFRWNGTNATYSYDISSGDGSYAYIGSQIFNGKSYIYSSSQNGTVNKYEYYSVVDHDYLGDITPDGATDQKFVNPYTVDPSDENYMYYIAGNKLWRNRNLSSSSPKAYWKSIELKLPNNDPQLPNGYTFSTLAVSRTNLANVLYLVASSTTGQPKIFKMANSKTDTMATDITSNLSASSGSYVHGIAINPDNASEILVVISNYGVKSLWYTSDGGTNWSDVEGNLSGSTGPSVRSATILPTTASITGKVYIIGTSTGVYSTSQMDGTNTRWYQEGSNILGNVVVEYVTSRKSDGTVVAATHGRGAFVGTNYTPSGIENENNLPTSFQLEQNYPNPFNPVTVISWQLAGSCDVKLKVYNTLGKEVATLVDSKMEAGNHKIEFNASRLASGVYIYRLTVKDPSLRSGQGFVSAKKMILLK